MLKTFPPKGEGLYPAQWKLNEIKSSFGDLVFKSVIKYSVKAKEAPVSGESLLSYDSSSEIANSYRMLAEEILNHE